MTWVILIGFFLSCWLLSRQIHHSSLKRRARNREVNIANLETELGMRPRQFIADVTPTNLQLDLNNPLMSPGDVLTLRCTYGDCDFTVETMAEDYTVISKENIPGGRELLQHQVDMQHWTANIKVWSWS